MQLDIVGYKLDDGIRMLMGSGVDVLDITVSEYTTPRNEVMGSDKRIIKVDNIGGKFVLVVGNF